MLKHWESGKLDVPNEIYDRIMNFPTELLFKNRPIEECRFKQIDLFAGIGGIQQPFQRHLHSFYLFSPILNQFLFILKLFSSFKL